jgi:hypothetical protein
VRESIGEIQVETDIAQDVSVSGISGRRSYVIIDPIKKKYNETPRTQLPGPIKHLLSQLYKKAANEQRKKITEPLPSSLWVTVPIQDPHFLTERRNYWVRKENEETMQENHFESTFWGRLGERVPAWAARLAICENPEYPVITNNHIDIAELSLVAELQANLSNQYGLKIDVDFNHCVSWILAQFKGNMVMRKQLRTMRNWSFLQEGAVEASRIFNLLSRQKAYRNALKRNPKVRRAIIEVLKERGIIYLSPKQAREEYGYGGEMFKKGTED